VSEPELTEVRTQTGRPAWQVNNHAAVKAWSRDPHLSDSDPKLVQPRAGEPPSAVQSRIREHRAESLGWSNVLRRAFSTERVDGLKPLITQVVGRLLDGIAAGRCPPDLHAQFSVPLVSTVTCALLGVPQEDGQCFRAWWDAVRTGSRTEAQEGQAALLRYVRDLMATRRRDPGDDFVSVLVAAEGATRSYTDRAVKFLAGLISKGQQTPTNALDWGVVLLLRDPDGYSSLVRDRRLVRSAVEEVLRLFPVISGKIQGPEGIRRFVVSDFDDERAMAKPGDLVLLNVVAANMDRVVFDDPARFDLRREPNPHLTFGFGPHACPASGLAKLELLVAIESLAERFPTLRLVVDATQLRFKEQPTSEGFDSLPVTW
jgi:cytochrome P450